MLNIVAQSFQHSPTSSYGRQISHSSLLSLLFCVPISPLSPLLLSLAPLLPKGREENAGWKNDFQYFEMEGRYQKLILETHHRQTLKEVSYNYGEREREREKEGGGKNHERRDGGGGGEERDKESSIKILDHNLSLFVLIAHLFLCRKCITSGVIFRYGENTYYVAPGLPFTHTT